MPFDNPITAPHPRRRRRRLPAETEIADALLVQALAAGHYLRTPADEECPSGTWLLIPLDRSLLRILDMAGAEHADLEDDERDADGDDELTVVSPHSISNPDGPAEWMTLGEWRRL
jgi:hypothetical protein